jgi:hypothetical protein
MGNHISETEFKLMNKHTMLKVQPIIAPRDAGLCHFFHTLIWIFYEKKKSTEIWTLYFKWGTPSSQTLSYLNHRKFTNELILNMPSRGIPSIRISAGTFYYRTSKPPSELTLNSAEFHGIPKGRVPRNSAVFRVRNSEFLCLLECCMNK